MQKCGDCGNPCDGKCEDLKDLLRELLEWVDSDAVQGCFSIAYVHGVGILAAEEAQPIQDMFLRAREAVEEKEEK